MNTSVASRAPNRRTLRDWLSSLPVAVVLLLVVFASSGEIIHSQLLRIGQATWDNYFLLRDAGNLSPPTCNPDLDVDKAVQAALARAQAAAAADPLNALIGDNTDANDVRKSLLAQRDQCRLQWQNYRLIQHRLTPSVRAYSHFEKGVAFAISKTGAYNRLLLCLLILICAATATATREHFAIRPAATTLDHVVSTGLQLISNLLLLISAVSYREVDARAMLGGVPASFFYLHAIWIAGFALMSAICVYQLIRPPAGLKPGGSLFTAGLTVPLYTYLCLMAGAFFFSHGFYAGIGVYTDTMMELTTMLLNLALYVWFGMMIRHTRLADLMFDVFRPWQLSPELLSFVVLMVSAVLTAYTGASGAYVMAASAVIYYELVRSGARKTFAYGTAAMSGSLGVVLSPCLLVVIIAAINNTVTTDEMFAAGFKVFVMTSALYLLVALQLRRTPIHVAHPRRALPASARAMMPLLPYAAIFALVIVFFRIVLNRGLDEFSAPVILPLSMLLVLFYEARFERRLWRWLAPVEHRASPPQAVRFERRLRDSTRDTTSNIGGLLMLVALSVSFGGIVERSGVMDLLPQQFSSIWIAMSLVVPAMILVGMFMDPYGAIILVNSSIAKLAFASGISPLHFWIVTMVAFEFGYLTPPVALNYLLARAAIGNEEVDRIGADETRWWRRYEHHLMPIGVMLVALLLVAYLPLAWPGLNHWLFQRIAVPG